MSASLDDLNSLILDIHAAPLDEARWTRVVDSIRRMVNADQALLFAMPQGPCEVMWNVGSQIDSHLTREYALEFAPEDTWGLAAKRLSMPVVGRVLTGEELLPRPEFRRTRFFNEFLRRYDIDRFLCALLRDPPFPGGAVGASLSLYRGCDASAFDAEERRILSHLAPHLVLALNTLWEVKALSLHTGALKYALDAVSVALFVIDHSGRLVFSNRSGQSVLSAGDCLTVVEGRLGPSPKVHEQRLCRQGFERLRLGHAETINLTVATTGVRMTLCTAPLSESSESIAPWGVAAGLAWLTPAKLTETPIRRIATLFSLSHAEERLVGLLACGHSLNDISERLRVSVHTVRSQLKSIQRKTGWHSQNEIILRVQQLSAIDPPTPS